MPATSKSQQRFFGLVRGVQKGKVSPDSVSPSIRKVAKSMSKNTVKKYASTPRSSLPERLVELMLYCLTEYKLFLEMKTPKSASLTDTYLSNLMQHTYENLNEDNKAIFLRLPLQMKAEVSYKILKQI